MAAKKKTTANTTTAKTNAVSNYKTSLEYLYSIFNSEKARYDNFNVRTNWILVFLGVLMMPIQFFWKHPFQCNPKDILYLICLIVAVVLLVIDSIMCLYSMVPKARFTLTGLDSFTSEKFDNFIYSDQTTFNKALIEKIAPQAKLYYEENQRKSKLIIKIYALAALIVVLYFLLMILKLC